MKNTQAPPEINLKKMATSNLKSYNDQLKVIESSIEQLETARYEIN